MLKFLRQYQSWILAIGGTLLLITFLVPEAITGLANYSARTGTTWATVGKDQVKLTAGDLDDVRMELRVVDAVGNQVMRQIGADRDPAHWYLLTREAEEAGLVGGEGDGRAVIDALAKQFAQNPDQTLFNLAQRSGTNPDTVLKTLAKMQGVMRLTGVTSSIGRVSDRRLESAASDALRGAACDTVVLDARTLAKPEVAEPTEEALLAQFEKFKETEPGKGERGFGYKLPDRVKLEWVEVAEAPVRAAIEASGAVDTLALKKRFAADPAKYGADPALAPKFADYEATVRTRTLDDLTAEKMAEIAKFASDQLALPLRGLPREGSHFALPGDWSSRQLALPALADQIAQRFGIPVPTYRAVGETWLSAKDLDLVTGLGGATTDKLGATPLKVSQVTAKLKEFKPVEDTAPTQVGVALPPFTGADKTIYVVRAIAADPSRAPATIDEVRVQVGDDVKSLERFAKLEAASSELLAKAKAEGPRAVANEYGATVEFLPTLREADPRFIGFGMKFGGDIPGLGNDPATVRAISREAARIPLDKPAGETPAGDRTFLVPVPDKMTLVLVRVDDVFPLTREEYQPLASNARVHRTLLDEKPDEDLLGTYSLEALMARHRFKRNAAIDGDMAAADEAKDGEAANKPS